MPVPTSPTGLLPADAALGPVHLTVTDLERSLAFYTGPLGLGLLGRDAHVVSLGTGATESLVLHGDPSARRAGRHAGLFHVALLYPSRLELARAALRLASSATAVDGASDHGTHEAIYLADPDGNGLELAADRSRELWPPLDELIHAGGPDPLDVPGLLALVAGEEPSPHAGHGLRIGHVHLHVDDLAAAVRFYREVVGLELTMQLPHAAFLAFGGYHHHIAVNVWRGRGIPGVPEDAVGMRHLTLALPGRALTALRERARAAGVEPVEGPDGGVLLRDPAGNALVLLGEA